MKRFLAAIMLNALATFGRSEEITLYYSSDKFELTTEHIQQLQPLLGAEWISIVGHTDNDATEDYNQELSRKRAYGVHNFFVENGFPRCPGILSFPNAT